MDNLVINALFTLAVFAIVCGIIIAIEIRSEKKTRHEVE